MKAIVVGCICMSIILGVFLAPYFAVSITSLIALFAVFFILSFSFIPHRWLWLGIICVGFIFTGVLLKEYQQYSFDQKKYHDNSSVSTLATVIEPPERRAKSTRVVLYDENRKIKMLATLPAFSDIRYGERYELSGKPALLDKKSRERLQNENIGGQFFNPKLKKIGEDVSVVSKFKGLLYGVRGRFSSSINKIFVEPEASLAAGLLLGTKSSFPDWLINDFSRTGTNHIVALSGFNITIIVEALRLLFSRRSRAMSFWVPVSVILLFVVMTGASPSVVRAGIMGSLLLLARKTGRQSSAAMAVILTASLMIMINPNILYDLSFQLSFVALLGIIYVAPLVLKSLPERIKKTAGGEILAATLGAQIMTFPLIIFYFGTFSLVSPLVNVIILPFIPLTMLLIFLAGLLGFVWSGLGIAVSWLAYALLHFIIWVIHTFGMNDFASISQITFSADHIIIAYFVILEIIFIEKMVRRKRVERAKA